MLRNGKCPQCGSSDVMTSPQGIGWDVNLMVTKGRVTVSTNDWMTYLCTGCGLFENYVTDQSYLTGVQSDTTGWTRL